MVCRKLSFWKIWSLLKSYIYIIIRIWSRTLYGIIIQKEWLLPADFHSSGYWYLSYQKINQILRERVSLFQKLKCCLISGRFRLSKENRPLALRDHVTNASFKQWVGILLMPKIDRAHKNYLTPEIWEETHLRKMFYGTLIFPQSSIICIGRHVGGHALALQHGGQNYFLLISCSTFDSYAQMCCKR